MFDRAPCQELNFFERAISAHVERLYSFSSPYESSLRKRLTVRLTFVIVTLRFRAIGKSRRIQGRAVSLAYPSFAFTYRFLFWRKRAGETRAGELID